MENWNIFTSNPIRRHRRHFLHEKVLQIDTLDIFYGDLLPRKSFKIVQRTLVMEYFLTKFVKLEFKTFTAWKVSKCRVFSGPYFPVLGLNTGKYEPEETPYLDTFHSVFLTKKGLSAENVGMGAFFICWVRPNKIEQNRRTVIVIKVDEKYYNSFQILFWPTVKEVVRFNVLAIKYGFIWGGVYFRVLWL